MSRSGRYSHPEGPDALCAALVEAFKPDLRRIISENEEIYKSIDMKVGIRSDTLVKNRDLLLCFVKIDTRGGYFMNPQLADPLKLAIEAEGLKGLFDAACLGKRDPDEMTQLIVYKVRCMLSHLRIKHDNATQDPQFKAIFEVMDATSSEVRPQKTRRLARLQHRPNPFIHFREPQSATAEEEYQPQVISKYFDGSRAVALYCNGETSLADMYEQSPTGFVVARWLEAKQTLELELTNDRCKDGHLVDIAPKVMKKPAKKEEEEQTVKEEKTMKKPAARAAVESKVVEAEGAVGMAWLGLAWFCLALAASSDLAWLSSPLFFLDFIAIELQGVLLGLAKIYGPPLHHQPQQP